MVDSTGTTSYDHYADAVYNEYPPGGRTVWYDYSFGDYGLRTDDLEVTSGTPYNTRLYTYDGRGRLRTVTLKRPGAAPGTYDSHLLTILYGPDGRPVSIADANTDTGTERWEDTYWSASARPIERVTTPDTSGPTTYTVDVYADADSAVTGSMRLQYVNGGFSSETRLYALHDPSGLPVEAYEFTSPEQATTELFRATYKPYGDMASSSGDTSLVPWRYDGQIVLTGSQAEVWSGQTVQTLRDPLIVGAARPWDAQVGEHMTPLVGGQAGTPILGNPYAGLPSNQVPRVTPGGAGGEINPGGPGTTLDDLPICIPFPRATVCPRGEELVRISFPANEGVVCPGVSISSNRVENRLGGQLSSSFSPISSRLGNRDAGTAHTPGPLVLVTNATAPATDVQRSQLTVVGNAEVVIGGDGPPLPYYKIPPSRTVCLDAQDLARINQIPPGSARCDRCAAAAGFTTDCSCYSCDVRALGSGPIPYGPALPCRPLHP